MPDRQFCPKCGEWRRRQQTQTGQPVREQTDIERVGVTEIGKKATIVVSDGNIFDPPTNKVVYEFIEGRKVDPNNRDNQLYDKYSPEESRMIGLEPFKFRRSGLLEA